MNWWDAFKLIIKFVPCVMALIAELKAAKQNDDKVTLDEIAKAAENFMACVTAKLEAAVKEQKI